jgi:glycosyltransferase involved in cell wall biosynthesis
MGSFRVLHAPTSTGGNPQALNRALRQLGVVSRSLVVSQNYLEFPADIVLHRPGQSLLLRELKRIWAIVWQLPRYDLIHYNSGTTIASAYSVEFLASEGLRGLLRQTYAAYLRALQLLELAYVRWLGKVVFVTYQGDDARQGDYSLAHFSVSIASHVPKGYYCPRSDRFKRGSIKRMATLASEIYAVNPDLMHVLPEHARFIPYGNVFVNEWTPCFSQDHSGPLRILHAPSHRGAKGTDVILSALEVLKEAGYVFELILVEGISNVEARKIYSNADILIDQLFAGWYGGLAVELMALGKPVIAYLRDEDLRFIDPNMRDALPIVRACPETVSKVLRAVLEMPRRELVALGRRSRAFVERWHDPEQIASMIKRDYELALAGKDARKT